MIKQLEDKNLKIMEENVKYSIQREELEEKIEK